MTVDGNAIKIKMIEEGINTNARLAELSGVNVATIGNTINGKYVPNAATMIKIANALNMTPEEMGKAFFGGAE